MTTKQFTRIILVLIILLRLSMVMLPSFKIDMNSWQAWSARIVEVTPLYFYAPNYFADYFPGYLYLLWYLGETFNFLFPHQSIFSFGFEIYLKLFTNLFDIATAYYIFKILSGYKKSLGLLPSIFYLANPALFFNSSVWGQVDGILTFFLVYSSYCLIELRKTYRFSAFSALSILVKPQGLAVFPIMLVTFLTNFKISRISHLLIIPVLLIILSLPFFLKDPIFGLFYLFQKSTGTYPYTSMFSYNFWSFAGWWIPDSSKLLNITYQAWGVILYFAALSLILIRIFIRKGYKSKYLLYLGCSLAIFAFFLFLTRIHQRYLFPFFAFLIIAAFIKNSIFLKINYIILSFVHLINLLYVYYYYNYVYPNPSFSSLVFYKFLSTNYNWFTLLNLAGFGILLYYFYKYDMAQEKA